MKKVERDFAPPPPHPVVWVIVDRREPSSREVAYAQTAYKAFEKSGIKRDGHCLSYGDVDVAYSERLTQAYWLKHLLGFLVAAHRRRKKPNRKLNGKRSR